MNNNKGLIVFLIAILVLAVAGIAYFGHWPSGANLPSPAPMNDNESIQAAVSGMLSASRGVKSPSDVAKVVETYYTPGAAASFKSALAKVSADSSSGDAMVKELQTLPAPSALEYQSAIVGSTTATATYLFKESPQVTVNGVPQETNQKTYLVVTLEEDNGKWLIDHMTFSLK